MVEYRIYRLDVSGRIAFVPDVMVCEDDAAAIIRAQRDINGHALEIWAGARRVALVPSPAAVSAASPAGRGAGSTRR